MIAVNFKFPESLDLKNGMPLIKTYNFNESIRYVKEKGIRPIEAYIYETTDSDLDLSGIHDRYTDENRTAFNKILHSTISYMLHPLEGKIVYDTDELADFFSL